MSENIVSPFNITDISVIRTFFRSSGLLNDKGANYLDNSVFHNILRIKIDPDNTVFLPTFSESIIRSKPKEVIELFMRKCTYYFPLFVLYTDYCYKAGTCSSLLKTLGNSRYDRGLIKIVTKSKDIFYGINGLILDENWEPLLLSGNKFFINSSNKAFTNIEPVLYVSPKVFFSNNLITKTIKEKVIPIATEKLAINNSSSNATVIIKDFSNYFIKPSNPTNIETLDNDIWDCLNENKDDLI